MSDRIYPARLVQPVSPLVYDGNDWHAVYARDNGVVRVETGSDLCYRNAVTKTIGGYYNVPSGSGETVRWSYTVPSGKSVILHTFFFWVDHPSTSGDCLIICSVAGRRVAGRLFYNGIDGYLRVGCFPLGIYVSSGKSIEIKTFNHSSSNVTMRASACFTEYDAT